jgi:colicin import membrane protein
MTDLILIDSEKYGIEQSKASELVGNLPQILSERAELVPQFNEVIKLDINDPQTAKKAAELRKLIKNNRTKGIEVWHKTTKDYFLKGGQFVDAIKRKEIAENERMEEALEQIEKHQENLEKERISKLQNEREGLLMAYEVENLSTLNLGTMNDDVFDSFLKGSIEKFNAKKEAERKAEEDRIAKEKAEAEERERIRLENERLKLEAEAREKEIAAERAKAEEALRIEREKAAEEQRKRDEVLAAERAENEKKLKAEREEKERIEKELQAKKEAEEKAEKERLAAEEKARKEAEKLAKAPIKKQLNVWVESFELPHFATEHETAESIFHKFEAFKNWAKQEIEKI